MADNLASVAECNLEVRPLMARAVSRALLDRLEKAGTSVHWVSVVGEESLDPVPTKSWPHEEAMINILIQDGWSEGCLIYVMGQSDRYRPDLQEPLLRIKMLTAKKRVLAEVPVIFEFLDSLEFDSNGEVVVK